MNKSADTEHVSECTVCGITLIYGGNDKEQTCAFCGMSTYSPIYCPEGHFVCDTCHAEGALDFLNRLMETETSTDPIEIVDRAMTHPSFKFHGPEHHSLVPAAILIAMKNRGVSRHNGSPITKDIILEGIRRGFKIPGGFCGYAGTCGACVGAGVALALYLDSTPKRATPRLQAHRATSNALALSQDELIRCCKRATYYGLTAAIEVLKNEYNVDLGPVPSPQSCVHSERNPDCAMDECMYHVASMAT